MTIPTTGPISFSALQTEFGGSNPISLSEYYKNGPYANSKPASLNSPIPTSGQISLSQFRGSMGGYVPGNTGTLTSSGSIVVPVYVDTIYISGAAGGGGGGGLFDDGCSGTSGSAGGGSSGQMVSNYTLGVTPGQTISFSIGGGGDRHGRGGNTVVNGVFTLYGGNPGSSGSPCNGGAFPPGSVPGGGPTGYFGYNGAWGSGTYGGAGGAGYNGTGGGGGGHSSHHGWSGQSGGNASYYGAGGGGGGDVDLDSGGSAYGGYGYQGFIYISW